MPSFRIPGFVTEGRELKATKSGQVWAYAVKVMALGGLFEMQTQDAKLYQTAMQERQGVFIGGFEFYNGSLKLQLHGVEK